MCIVVWGRCGVSWRAVVAFLCRGGVGSTLRGSLSILCVALTCRLHFACVVEHSVVVGRNLYSQVYGWGGNLSRRLNKAKSNLLGLLAMIKKSL